MKKKLKNITYEDYIDKGITWSVTAHVLLGIFLVFKNYILPATAPAYIPTLKVDLVGLPDTLKKDLKKVITKPVKQKKPEKKEPPVKKAIKKKALTYKPPKHQLKNAIDRIKALDKITTLDQQEKTISDPIKGNKISKGSTLTGKVKESDKASYYDHVLEKLRSNWILPVWLSRQNLSAQVVIYINRRGLIDKMTLKKSSGNRHFDDAVKKTIIESQPFHYPNLTVLRQMTNGILLGFPL